MVILKGLSINAIYQTNIMLLFKLYFSGLFLITYPGPLRRHCLPDNLLNGVTYDHLTPPYCGP